jgi:hypothetical protein
MKLYATPSSPISKQNTTVLFTVTNNLTEGKILQSITPKIDPPTVTGSATADYKSGPNPASVNSLSPGEMAFFEWTYYVEGNKDNKITYNTTIANAVQGNFVTDTTQIAVPPVSESAINEVLGGQVGIISMNFTSFEYCEPASDDCTSDSSAWAGAWNVTKNTKFLWRMNSTNNGIYDITLEKHTSLFMLLAVEQGGTTPKTFFIKADSTTTNEDPGVYNDHSKVLTAGGVSQIIYFGLAKVDETTLENTDNDVGVSTIFVLLFGHEDKNTNGYDSSDTPYSQNLPFKSILLS